ncbi:MAG: transglutaminaseTgpA domain-containing protein, partial [Acidimicrobiia bacterium]
MGRRFGQLAGLVAFALVLGRLGRLMLSGQEIPNWNLILVASAFLGGIVWWLISQTIGRRGLAFTLFGLAALVLFLRISVGETLTFGVVPTDATSQALSQSLENAISQIRHGVPPIAPTQGVIAVLAVIAWVVGALYAWGATTGPAAAMVVPSIVLYLQFAIFDRNPAGLGWMIASAGMIALAVVSIGLERKRDVGRARDSEGRPKPVRTGGAAVAMAALVAIAAITGANVASGLVSEYGNVPWRSGGGFGLGPGGSDFVLQRFADLRQRLINRSEEPLFYVSLGDRAPDPSQISYRMETLDSYNGTIWDRSSRDRQLYEPDSQLGDPSNVYQGTTRTFSHTVTIAGLGGVVAPTGGVPVTIDENREGIDPISPLSFRVNTSDSSLEYPSLFRNQLSYQVTTEYPLQSSDIGALATGSDGQLSPIFQGAKTAGALDIEPTVPEVEVVEPADLEFFRTRDESVPSGVTNLAFTIVQGAETDYERAILLEHFFRASTDRTGEPNFIYNDLVD